MSQKLKIPPKEELKTKHQSLSISDLAAEYNTSRPTIRKWLEYYDIEKIVYRAKASPRLAKEIWDKLNDRQWLHEQRVIKKRSMESIAEELGCSVIPVKQACIKQNVVIRLNESEPVIKNKLNDYDWLYKQHVLERKSVRTIANEIGSSAATVALALKHNGIPANNTNSYPRLNNKTSKECQEVIDYLKELGIENIIVNDRTFFHGTPIEGLEIDILLPEYKIAIEYNGVYSHLYRPEELNFSRRKDEKFHLSKTTEAEKKGYQLFHIFSDDWKENKDIWKSILQSKLSKTTTIAARKCKVVIPTNNQKIDFLKNNHLQGQGQSTIAFALEYSDELVAIMTFRKSLWSSKYQWELNRYAGKAGYTIVGGFSRLLKAFEREYSGSIISYADYSRSTGNVYSKNGFELERTNKPSYWYVKNGSEKRLHRAGFQKKRLLKLFDVENENDTEEAIMNSNGYHRIWDCGSLTFIKKRPGN